LSKIAVTLSEILNEKRTIEILKTLQNGPQHIRSLHRAIGGSMSTIVDRVNSLLQAGLLRETELSRREKYLELTERGKAVVSVLDWLEMSVTKSKMILDRPKKWILALLYVLEEIKGSTRLEKLLFLLKEQFGVTGGPFYQFTPYLFGPFSSEILEDAKALRDMGLIDISLDTIVASELSDAIFIRKTYRLTEKGKEKAKKCYMEIASDERVREAIYKMREYNSMPLSNLLNYVYEKFPSYSPPPEMP